MYLLIYKNENKKKVITISKQFLKEKSNFLNRKNKKNTICYCF